LLEEAPQGPEN